jgi:cardiolipin synthase
VPIIVYLMIAGAFLPAFWLFILAGISDGIDGFVAKRFHMQTELGAYLDPVADKALLVSIFVTLGVGKQLPVALVLLVVSRDILIIGAVLLSWLLERRVEMAPLMVSKVNTTLQIMLAGAVLANHGFNLHMQMSISALIVAVSIFTIWSGASYMIGWARHMANYEEPLRKTAPVTSVDKAKLAAKPMRGEVS